MALGITLMKLKLAVLSLSLCSCSYAQEHKDTFDVFGGRISLDQNCNLVIAGAHVELPLPKGSSGNCRFVTHANTSIVQTHFINGAYIIFVERNQDIADGCISEHTAFAIRKDGEVKTTTFVQKSGSCYQAREMKDFEMFSAYLHTNK